MESFQYVDMFATKGIEYLLVILFLLVVAPFWLWMRRAEAAEHPEGAKLPKLSELPGLALMRRPLAPGNVLIDAAHTWLRPLEKEGTLALGIDSFITEALGDLDGIEVPAPGTAVAAGDPLLTLQLGDRSWVLPAPVDGEVLRVGQEAVDRPRGVIADPYGPELVVLKPNGKMPETTAMREGEEANTWLDGEFRRLIDLLTAGPAEATPYFADGAYPTVGIFARVDDTLWDAFQSEFLSSRGDGS